MQSSEPLLQQKAAQIEQEYRAVVSRNRLWHGAIILNALFGGLLLLILISWGALDVSYDDRWFLHGAWLILCFALLIAVGLPYRAMWMSPASLGAALRAWAHERPTDAALLWQFSDVISGQFQALPGWQQAVQHQVYTQTAHLSPEGVYTETFSRTTKRGHLVGLLLLVSLFVGMGPDFQRTASWAINPYTATPPQAAFSLSILGDSHVVRAQDAVLRVEASGQLNRSSVVLHQRNADESVVTTRTVALDSSNTTIRIPNVQRPLTVWVSQDGVESARFGIRVLERPRLEGLQIRITPPSYTGIPPFDLPQNIGDVRVPERSVLSLTVSTAGAPIAQGMLTTTRGDTLPLRLQGASGTLQWQPEASTEYSISLASTEGVASPQGVQYAVTTIADRAPQVEIRRPEQDASLSEQRTAQLAYRVVDDYAIDRAELLFHISERRFGVPAQTVDTLVLPLSGRQPLQDAAYAWDMSTHPTTSGMLPGDVLSYYIRVRDVRGSEPGVWSRSPVHVLRLPSLADRYTDLTEAQDQTSDALTDLDERVSALSEQFASLRDEIRRKASADWRDQQEAASMASQQASIEEQVSELQQQIEETNQFMDENELVSEETMALFESLQEVAEEIENDALNEAMRDLQEAMEDMDFSAMQEAMERYEFQEEQYRERLARTLDLFKNLRAQQEMEAVINQAEDLAERESALQEETAQAASQETPPSAQERAELAEEQSDLAEDAASLEEDIERVSELLSELRSAPQASMRRLEQEISESPPSEAMEKAAQHLSRNQMQQGMQQQQQATAQLSGIRDQMENMLSGMQQQSQQANLQLVRQVLGDLLYLSTTQEALRDAAYPGPIDAENARVWSREQQYLAAAMRTVADSLSTLGRQVPQVSRTFQERSGAALSNMERAIAAVSERQVTRAYSLQTDAMTASNELALMLNQLLNQMQSSSSMSGQSNSSMQQLLQQLQNMAMQQQGMNEQLQQMLNDAQGNRLTANQQQRLQQLALQQSEMKAQLEQMARNPNARGRMLGDLARIAAQMEESIRELQSRTATRQTVARQQEILTKLLQASRSMQERGKDEERESRQASNTDRIAPSGLVDPRNPQQLRQQLQEALRAGYASDYEDLIRRYFELLEQSLPTTPESRP